MKYLSILGRQPELGLLELESLLGADKVQPFGKHTLISELPDINRLGGTIKLGRVIYEGDTKDLSELDLTLPQRATKTTFGISYYGQISKKDLQASGLELKKRLRSEGSVRFVGPTDGTTLSAASVRGNKLIDNGFELLVVTAGKQMVVALTTAVQDVNWYSRRDYDRPARSAKVGMLPPKLAQIMINTVDAGKIYDPFCGTGVILQEALLMGRESQGSDLSAEMVTATRQNLEWLKDEAKAHGIANLPIWAVSVADARKVIIPDEHAIVSEGYLGQNQSTKPNDQEYARLKSEAEALYHSALKAWAQQLPSGSQVTITVPVWHTTSGWKGTAIIDSLPDLGYSLRSFSHAKARELIYRRPDQIVGRQLLLLRKN